MVGFEPDKLINSTLMTAKRVCQFLLYTYSAIPHKKILNKEWFGGHVNTVTIKPIKFYDKVLEKQIKICKSPQFTTIHVGDRVFYFTPDGDFDGTSRPMGEDST